MEKYLEKSYENNNFKISGPTWIENFKLPDGLYSASNIQDYFGKIIKKHEHEAFTDNLLIRIYISKIEDRITFKIKDIMSNF